MPSHSSVAEKKCDLRGFELGIVIDVRRVGMSIYKTADFQARPSTIIEIIFIKRKK